MPETRWGNLQKSDDDTETIEQAILRLIAGSGVFGPNWAWGNLPKSQIDSETIEQAIARLIIVHEADPNSHMGPGEAIENHRQSEILDHLARSVYTDKFAHDRAEFNTNFESIDSWQKTGGAVLLGPNQVTLTTLASSNNFQWLTQLVQGLNSYIWKLSNLPYWRTRVFFRDNTNQYAYIVQGQPDPDPDNEPWGYGFKIENNNLYAIYYDASHIEQKTAIPGFNLALFNVYACEIISTTHIKFFVNDILVADLDGITLYNNYGSFLYYFIKTTNASSKYMEIQDLIYNEERSLT